MPDDSQLSRDDAQCDEPKARRDQEPEINDYIWPGADVILKIFSGKPNKREPDQEIRSNPARTNWLKLVVTVVASVIFFRGAYVTGWINSADDMVAAFTVVLSVVAALQWWITKQQVRQTEETLELMRYQNRAYVTVSKAVLRFSNDEGIVNVDLTIRNSGQTPAFNVETYCIHDVVTFHGQLWNVVPESPTPQRFPPKATIGSGGKIIASTPKARDFDARTLTGKVLYVWGYVEWLDIFGEKHSHPFGFYSAGGSTILPGNRMAFLSLSE